MLSSTPPNGLLLLASHLVGARLMGGVSARQLKLSHLLEYCLTTEYSYIFDAQMTGVWAVWLSHSSFLFSLAQGGVREVNNPKEMYNQGIRGQFPLLLAPKSLGEPLTHLD